MSASHTTPTAAKRRATKDGAKKERLTILPGVGLVDLNDPAVAGKLAERLAEKVGDQLVLFAQYMQEGLLAASVAIGLDVMAEFMEADVTEIAGPKGRHNPDRAAYRHGHEQAAVTLGGRRVAVTRPRVRGVAGTEVHLESYKTFACTYLLTAQTVAATGSLVMRTVSSVSPPGVRRTITDRRRCRSMPTYCRSTVGPPLSLVLLWEARVLSLLGRRREVEAPLTHPAPRPSPSRRSTGSSRPDPTTCRTGGSPGNALQLSLSATWALVHGRQGEHRSRSASSFGAGW